MTSTERLCLTTCCLLVFLITIAPIFSRAVVSDKGSSLGKVDFPVSCDDQMQADFNKGVALIHHMMYEQAGEVFVGISEKDEDCAMAYWGIAMSQFHPLWSPPSAEELDKGQAAAVKAGELEPGTPREKAYINAINTFYADHHSKDHSERITAWSEAQEKVFRENPDDVDAGAFYALSILATAPKGDKTFSNQEKAGEILERLHKEYPEHPGLFHYTIHAYDNPALAERAVPVARGYDKLAPEVPHALHMPSHIFVRLGIWPDTIDWNIRSANAAKEQSGEAISLHYPHAADYLIYAYLQQGKDKKASEVIDELVSAHNYQDSFASAYALAAANARYTLERADWQGSAALSAPSDTGFDWGKYPQYEAISHYARGIGAARSGDLGTAKHAKAKLDKLYEQTAANGEEYWAVIVDAQRKTVDAWIEYTDGDKEKGLLMMKEAADLEDSVDKHPVTPGAVMPARDMYADMLILSDKPAEALEAYEASLRISPNRFYSLYGAGYAAEQAGNTDKAVEYYTKLVELASEADSERERVDYAKKYLSDNDSKS